MPPPITSIRFGISESCSAPVESTRRGSSYGKPGIFATDEPAAITQWSNETVDFFPSAAVTSIMWGDVKRPTPVTTSTLRCFARPARPFVRRPTTPSFQPRSASMSTSGLPNFTPKCDISSASEITRAACSSAFDGMQPTFRQTPPIVA